jgi:hypothetical protein
MEHIDTDESWEAEPSSWFLYLAQWRPEYHPMFDAERLYMIEWILVYLLSSDRVKRKPKNTNRSKEDISLSHTMRDSLKISRAILIKNPTPSAVVGKIKWDVLAK